MIILQKLKLLFKDVIIKKNNNEKLLNILKTDDECYRYCQNIFNEKKCFKNIKEVLIHLINGIELKLCKKCGKYILFEKILEYKRHNREINYCNRKCAPNNFNTEFAKIKRLKKLKENNPFSKQEVKDKIKHTNLIRYGVENVSQNLLIKYKKQQTILKNYNTINYFKSNIYKQKIFKSFSKFKNYIIPMFTENEYDGYNKEYTWKCVKCRQYF